MPARTATQLRITVGARVQFPHRCVKWSLCDGTQTGTVYQLTDGGMTPMPGRRFAHVMAPCGTLAVLYTAELVEA